MRIASVRAALPALILLGASAAPAVADGTFRCGNKLIETGTTQVARWTYESYSATRVLVFDGERLVSIR